MQEHVALAGLAPPHCQGPSNASAHIPAAHSEGLPGSAPARLSYRGRIKHRCVFVWPDIPSFKACEGPEPPCSGGRDWILLPGLNQTLLVSVSPSLVFMVGRGQRELKRPGKQHRTHCHKAPVCWALLPLLQEGLGPMRPHSGHCTDGHKHTRCHPHFAQLGIPIHKAEMDCTHLYQFTPLKLFFQPLETKGWKPSHSPPRTEVTGHTGNALLTKSATGHKIFFSVATLPGLGRHHTQNVGRGIKRERIMQGTGSREGDRGIRNDQENHQKPSRMPAYI